MSEETKETENAMPLFEASITAPSRNISEEKRDEVERKLDQMDIETSQMDPIKKRLREDEKKGDGSAKQLLNYIEGLEDIKRELRNSIYATKYGLVFEDHCEEIEDKLKTHVPVLTEKEELIFPKKGDKEGTVNFLIEGDNLASLQLLKRTHTGKIDLIYIDPPYNTGNGDFIFGDKFVSKTDTYRHSKWLSFMSKRLELASELLSEEGIIFISIDDNEQAHLKLLCDKIFGEKRFYGQLIQLKGNAQNDAKAIQGNHEYILVYSKEECPRLLTYHKYESREVFESPKGTFYYEGAICGVTGNNNTLFDRKNLGYTIYYLEGNEANIKKGCELYPDFKSFDLDGKTVHAVAVADYDRFKVEKTSTEEDVYTDVKELVDLGYEKIRPPLRSKNTLLGRWTWEIEEFMERWNDGRVLIKDKKAGSKTKNRAKTVVYKEFVSHEDVMEVRGKKFFVEEGTLPIRSIVDIPNSPGTDQLKARVPGADFNNPKSLELMDFILRSRKLSESATVLDFFAGSGTTGEAVMRLNEEDGGKRNFILCTNNENGETNEEEGICRKITYPRIKNAIEDEKYKATIKYFQVDFVPNTYPPEDPKPRLRSKRKFYLEYANELLKHVRELLELEKAINFKENEEIAIILTKEDLDEFMFALKKAPECKCKAVYLSYKIFLSGANYELLAQKGITDEKINRIPDYYHRELSK